MPINNLEEIRKIIDNKKNYIHYSVELTRENQQNNKAKSLVIAIVCMLFVLLSRNVIDSSFVVLFMAIVVGVVVYRMTLEKSAFLWHNKWNGNALTWLFENHFSYMENLREYNEKNAIAKNNSFLQQYNNFSVSKKFVYSGEINAQKITFIEFDKKTLLISISINGSLIINTLYIAERTEVKLTGNLQLPTKQKFDYFPELMRYFNCYAEQKIETAQFLQANEDIFIQMTKFTKYNLAIACINNQVHCLLRGVDMDLLADVDYEVNLDDKEIADYFQQLEELSNFINLLQQIK